ncbi:hypothetical protein GCM10008994_27130 [Halorubrum ejinorense]|uniref:Uncharacterized protein n=2 Tax=Halorubrum ejinorense TaxID=425309 RepID=A0AAV3SW18_9EURY
MSELPPATKSVQERYTIMDDSNQPERPPPDADAAEIAQWMEEDFGRAIAEAAEEHASNKAHEVVEVKIINHEQDEVVGTIDTDGNLNTESEALRRVSQEYLDEGVPVLVPTTYENEDGETVHADCEVIVEPGSRGFVRAFVDELPSPFDCGPDVLINLPAHDLEQD